MKKFSTLIITTLSLLSAGSLMADNRIRTIWAEDINHNDVLPEYPRPIMERTDWMNLNGTWKYRVETEEGKISAEGDILVPFAIESQLSGVNRRLEKGDKIVYERDFTIPRKWKGKNIILNFGAVDWKAEVILNGQVIGTHTGGYASFSYDITGALKSKGRNRLTVNVWDPTDDGFQPRGKQVSNPGSIWYTPVSGIWQTVWIEPVEENHYISVKITPDIDKKTISVTAPVGGHAKKGLYTDIYVYEGTRLVAHGKAAAGREQIVKMPDSLKLWSPDTPFLYDIDIRLSSDGKVMDEVSSYTAMRKFSTVKDKSGKIRLGLNNMPLFQFGPLDQGWWPDGLYTAPTDEALASDIIKTKELGFNMIRKHIKVEPARWYTWCDRLGLIVWQDMPSGDKTGKWQNNGYWEGDDVTRTEESAACYRKEWKEIIDQLISYPCIGVWVPFNEAWGQFDTESVASWTKSYDPTRLVNPASGGNHFHCGDILDVHNYPDPNMYMWDDTRANVLGEYGGIGYVVKDHLWEPGHNWGYVQFNSTDEVTEQYVHYVDILNYLSEYGLGGAVYTQTTDVETEINGLMTYDRKVLKVDQDKVRNANWRLCHSLDDQKMLKVPAIAKDEKVEAQVEELLSGMSLEEKAGQMCQLTCSVLVNDEGNALDEQKMDRLLGEYKVGSILNVPYNVSQTKEVWHDFISAIQKKTLESTGIPTVYGVDQIHGASYTVGATFFPQGVNMAATFNRELVRSSAEINAYETRACNIPWNFSPVVDLGRDPRWSRMWENYGEDPYMNAQMGSAAVLGYQGNDPNHIDEYHVAACLKHFMGYGVPVSGKDRTPSKISTQELKEKHFAPYVAAIRSGALSIMVNSASNNGMPLHADHELLTEWLKEGLDWDGVIVTDWNDIINLYTRERIATDQKDAVRIAINAGIDMSMVPFDESFCTDLVALVNEGLVSTERVDDAVRRILRMKIRLGLFDRPDTDPSKYDKFACKEFAQKSLEAALESEVLLKNSGNLLPLAQGTKILLTGPNADSMRCLNGGWSYSWSGDRVDEFAGEYHTIREALTDRFGKKNVTYVPGVDYIGGYEWWKEGRTNIDPVIAAAKDADVIIACIGENSYCETPGNLDDLSLSEKQADLVKALSHTGKPLILILNEGRPRIIRELEPLAQAIVDILLPSNYGADALAQLLAGDENFSGKLPFTYPKYVNSLTNYDFKPSEQTGTMAGEYNYNATIDVQWPFGHGLSYTNFRYSNMKCSKSEFRSGDTLKVTVDIENTGGIAGKEAVLLYSSDVVASLIPDVRRLRDFQKISLEPGEKKTVMLEIEADDLAFVDRSGRWTLEKGEFILQCGSETLSIQCTENRIWQSSER